MACTVLLNYIGTVESWKNSCKDLPSPGHPCGNTHRILIWVIRVPMKIAQKEH